MDKEIKMLDLIDPYDFKDTITDISNRIDDISDRLDSSDMTVAITEIAAIKRDFYSPENLPAPEDIGAVAAASLLDAVYPVGSVYISASDVSPASFMGGTWTKLEDVFLLSAGDIYPVGSTGGEAAHTLIKSEMPAHTHWQNGTYTSNGTVSHWVTGDGHEAYGYVINSGGEGWHAKYVGTNSTGGGAAHNNMPPYLAVNMWQRVA